jgi:predicted ATPase/class 3 adenylate cyclase/Tfp pilus assembly protein PilF
MVDLAGFQKRLKYYCRTNEYKQHQLARDIGLSPTAFSNKLNGTRGAPLSRQEIKNIITRLAQIQAINSRREVAELLSLMDLKEAVFSPSEWQRPPFDKLEPSLGFPASSNGVKVPAQDALDVHTNGNGTGPISINGKDKPRQLLTFLFTNFEESTRLWQAYPGLMPAILQKHNRIVQESIEGEGGKVFKNTAKVFFSNFTDPLEAVRAAATLQKRLQAADWPDQTGPVMVTIALHTGVPEMEEAGAYFGQAVNRTGELLDVGQPGQVLLSAVTAGLLRDQLPTGLNLRDLGQQHLKFLDRTETIFQLEGSGLPDGFAPLPTAEGFPGNLPFHLTSFVGRESEQKEIRQLLATRRLLMLTGMGGVGKTRLALEVAGQVKGRYKDGVWLVELAPITNPTFVAPALSQLFGLKEEFSTPLMETLLKFIKNKQMLLVLDNCEHLVEECALLADRLLRTCPGLTILATSRTALEITGETVRQIQALEVPIAPQSLAQLTAYPCLKLFSDRAEAVDASFRLDDTTARLAQKICLHLDGIPLALELAAARLYTASLTEVAASLDQRFETFAGGNRAGLPRHQTLKALVDWSYNLLPDREQRLFRRISVFPGSWQFEALTEVCVGEEEDDSRGNLKEVLFQLVGKSLVITEKEGEAASYHLLETIRLYGKEKLEQSGEAATTYSLFCNYYLRLAEEGEAGLRGPQSDRWMERLKRELGNFRSIIGQVIAGSGSGTTWPLPSGPDRATLELLLRMGGALGLFWIKEGYWSEGQRWLETVLAFTTGIPVDPIIEAKARLVAGDLTWTQGDYPQAKPLLIKSLERYRHQGDKMGISEASLALGKVASKQGNFEEAADLFSESLKLKEELGDFRGLAEVFNHKGQMALNQFDYEAAKTCYRQSLDYYRQTGQKEGAASILNNLAAVAARIKDYSSGEALARESLQIYRQLENRPGIIAALNTLGIMAYRQSRISEAIQIHNECLEKRVEMGDKPGMAASYQNLGNIAYSEKEYKAARKHFSAALAIYRETGERNYFPRVLNNLANIDLLEKNYAQARISYEECLAIYQETGDTGNCASTLGNLGLLAYLSDDYPKALHDYSACLSLGLKLGINSINANTLTGLAGVYFHLAQASESAATPVEVAKYKVYLNQASRIIGAISTYFTGGTPELGHTEFGIYNETVAALQARLSEKAFNDLVEEGQANPTKIFTDLVRYIKG